MGKIINLFDQQEHTSESNFAASLSMNSSYFRAQIIVPSLILVNLHSPSLTNLLLGTALAESGLETTQHAGAAFSFFNIPISRYHNTINYLNLDGNASLKTAILGACYCNMFPPAASLMWNLRLAVLISAVFYDHLKFPYPSSTDIPGLAYYWKMHYAKDTDKQSDKALHFIDTWHAYVDGKS